MAMIKILKERLPVPTIKVMLMVMEIITLRDMKY